jgi:hypothetical protein
MKSMLIALTACATLALAGCGGDDGDKKDESSALAKPEFIKQADAICKAGTEKIDEAEKVFADPDNPTEAEITKAVDDVLVPELTTELEKLRDLEPPADDKDEIDSMLDSLEKAIADIDKDWRTGFDSQNIKDANAKATAYGFKECGAD